MDVDMFEASLQSVESIFLAHPYAIVFVGLLFAGETILLPAIYVALPGKVNLSYVVALALLATLISDTFWYYVGLHSRGSFFARFIEGRLESRIAKLSRAYERRAGMFLFLSKYVYGTRTVAQVLAVLHKMPMRRYQCVNFLGVLSLILVLIALAYSTDLTVGKLGDVVHGFEISFLVFAAIVVAGHLVVGGYIKKTWSRR
jgi:membrane protein DedA with SNARE-associated domain